MRTDAPPLATHDRLAVPLQTRSCHSSVAPSREVKPPVICWTALPSASCPCPHPMSSSRGCSQAVRVPARPALPCTLWASTRGEC